MNKSWLLYYALLTGLAATGSLAENAHNIRSDASSASGRGSLGKERAVIWERVEYIIVEREALPRRVVLERIPEPTAPVEGAAASLRIPKPTAAPRKRQDSGQVQALSAQIQQLSLSVSLASSASQSISQSAQQVQQSAAQAARDNSQALSRTQSSASSAIALASQQANDRVAQASSSASSQIAFNLASVQSSASSAISVAQVSASSSMASAMDVAMSQIQAARAEATAVRSDANNFADQVQRNAISTTNLAIIVSTSVSGAVILTSIIVCVFLRYRRKRKEARDRRSPTPDEKDYDRPVAVRGSVGLGTSRFNPFGGGNYPMEKLKLPTFSSRTVKKEEPLNFGFAMSDYSDNGDYGDYKEKPTAEEKGQERIAMSNPAQGFRLQKPPNIKSAEAVRVIRVNSKKDKEQTVAKVIVQDDPLPEYALSAPTQADPKLEIIQEPAGKKPVASAVTAEQLIEEKPTAEALKAPTEVPRESRRDTTTSQVMGGPRESIRFTMLSDASTEPLVLDNNRYTMMSQVETSEEPGWRPPSSRASRANSMKAISTTQRLPVRESDVPVPEPVVTGPQETNSNFSMGGVSSLLRSDSANMDNRQPTIPNLPKGPKTPKGPKPGPSFTTFPTVRTGQPSIVNRPRPAMVGKLRQKEREAET